MTRLTRWNTTGVVPRFTIHETIDEDEVNDFIIPGIILLATGAHENEWQEEY